MRATGHDVVADHVLVGETKGAGGTACRLAIDIIAGLELGRAGISTESETAGECLAGGKNSGGGGCREEEEEEWVSHCRSCGFCLAGIGSIGYI